MQTINTNTSLYFASKNAEINHTVTFSSPADVPVRINMYIEVLIPNQGVNEIKKSLPPIVSGSDYTATFDINNVLFSELFSLENEFAFPGDPDNAVILRDFKNTTSFNINWSYNYIDGNGDVQEIAKTNNSFEYWAIMGDISRVMKKYLTQEGITFLEWLNAEDSSLKFLSWIPNNLHVHPSQPLRIWFYNDSKMDNVKLLTKATFTDGTESAAVVCSTNVASRGLFECSCGPMELRLPYIDITKTVASYKVWLQNSDGTIKTEEKNFVIDYSEYERNDILFFTTSLGVTEVLWCKGRRSEKLKTTIEERTHPLATNKYNNGTTRAYRGELEYPFEMNTGWYNKNMRHYLADFLSSGEAKLPVKFFHMPVIVKAALYDWGNDSEDLFSVSFKVQLAHTENYYSPVPDVESPWGDFNIDFNEDFF